MKKNVLTGLALMIFCFISGGAYIATSTQTVVHQLEKVNAFHQVKFLRQHLEHNIKAVQTDLLLQGSPHSKDFNHMAHQIEATADSAANCLDCHHAPETRARLEKLEDEVGTYMELLTGALTMEPGSEGLEEARGAAFSQGESLLRDVDALSTDSGNKISQRISGIKDDIKETNYFLWACLILGPITIIAVTAFFLRRFTGSVQTLVNAAQTLEGGDLDYRITTPLKGEFHTVAEAFNRMVDAIKEERRKFESVYKTYQTLFETAGDAIMITDIEEENRGKIISANKAASEMYGYPIDELVGLNITHLVPPGKEEHFLAQLRNVMSGEWSHMRVKRQKKDGTIIRIDLSMGLLELGEKRSLLSFCRDVTEQVRAEQELQRANQMALVGQMSAGLAHEIKNPLAGIKVSLDVLADDLNLEPEDRELFAKIVNEINRVEKLLKSLLNYARPPKPQFDMVDMTQLLDHALGTVEATAKSKDHLNIGFTRDYPSDLPLIEADFSQMQQVLMNVLFNAIDAIDAEGTITIGTHKTGVDGLLLTISDTGRGMPPDSIDKIFTPFFTTRTKGTGLGLSICKSLVEQHGGYIEVDSEVGCGTSFTIALPLSQTSREQAYETERAHFSAG
ncbi:MAG: ATP-binding protein [Desulfuromonadales bacterium]